MVVLELLKYRVPGVVILLTLLIQWNDQIPHGIDLFLKLVIFWFSHVFPLGTWIFLKGLIADQWVFSCHHVLRTGILWRYLAAAVRSVVLCEMFLGLYHSLHGSYRLLNVITNKICSWEYTFIFMFMIQVIHLVFVCPVDPSRWGWLAPRLIYVWMQKPLTSQVLLRSGFLVI